MVRHAPLVAKRYAFTLVEVLIVIAIVVVVAGILVPVLLRSRRGALVSKDISNLRQIGLAASMYQEQYDSKHPMSVLELVDSGNIRDKDILRSTLDTTEHGIAYDVASDMEATSQLRSDLFLSYPGLAEYAVKREFSDQSIDSAHMPGWLVSVATASVSQDVPVVRLGKYYRLLMDGSVQVRHMNFVRAFNPDSGEWEDLFFAPLYFVDEGDTWVTEHI